MISSKFVLVLTLVVMCTGGAQAASCEVPADMAALKAQSVDLVNTQRQARGLQAVSANSDLTKAAQKHACDMAVNGYFSHTGRNRSNVMTRVQATGYSGCQFAENIALGLSESKSVIDSWMKSSGHKGNILLRKVDEMGMGIAVQDGRMLWVQVLACKR